ncbi:YciI family protein [Streptosporangium sp. NPDC050855]|uniref:YciI family protein n=1 Tax=Streptosporangium sp. NPDC050855 TaxID=3366194 RepID=UPI0037ABA6FE
MKYVLMFIETEQYRKDWEAKDQSERDAAFEKVGRWFADHSDKITHSTQLHPAPSATTVRLEGGGEPVVVDGPFVEGKEVVSGYVEAELPDLDEALRMAKSWPACPVVEVRPAA